MRRLTIVEQEASGTVRLTAGERETLLRLAPGVQVVPALGQSGGYSLNPGALVGAINLGTMAIEIRPKLAITHLLFLLAYTFDPRHWRQQRFDLTSASTMLDAIVPAFTWHVRRATRCGLLSGYVSRETSGPVIRGRLRIDEQVRRHCGRFPPVETRFDDYTVDIPENRLLKTALVQLHRAARHASAGRLVAQALGVFREVALLDASDLAALRAGGEGGASALAVPALAVPAPGASGAHYQPALALAVLILRTCSIEMDHGAVPATAFLVDMSRVFEDFVVTALRQALRLTERSFPQGLAWGASSAGPAAGPARRVTGTAGGSWGANGLERSAVLDRGAVRGSGRRTLTLDQDGQVHLVPDLSWWDGPRCTFVGDVKYRRVGQSGIDHPDLYQLLAYTVAAGLPGGLLVYAAGGGATTPDTQPLQTTPAPTTGQAGFEPGAGEPPRAALLARLARLAKREVPGASQHTAQAVAQHTVRHAGKELSVMALDLSLPPEGILDGIQAVASRISELRRSASRRASRPAVA